MSTTYHKINGAFKRDERGNFIMDEWSCPEFGYLADLPWRFTEKVDGCVSRRTRVRMADGTTTPIHQVKAGDYVLGYDTETLSVTPVKVNAVQHQPSAGQWVEVTTTRTGLGSGNSFGRVRCTHDHRIWTPDRGYVEAHELREGDRVLNCRADLTLTPVQEAALLGKVLGDGSVTRHPTAPTASVEWAHVETDEDYVDWCLRSVGDLAGSKSHRVSGYGSNMVAARTRNTVAVAEMFADFINESGTKVVPERVAEMATPLAIAFWFMDDGSLSHSAGQEDRACIATNGFDETSVKNLLGALARFGIDATIADRKGPTIVLDSANAERLFLLIAPYIPLSMQRKIPERYRGQEGWLPPVGRVQFHQTVMEQEVLSVAPVPPEARWDIETDTHNFFTAGMLVHNTNIRITFDGQNVGSEHLWVGGRTDKAQIPPKLLAACVDICRAAPFFEVFSDASPENPVVLYGEGYGAGIQKVGGLYRPDQSFVMFDIRVGRWWLTREAVNDIGLQLGIDTVPEVWATDPMSLSQAIDAVRETSLGGNTWLRSTWSGVEPEGVVGVPAVPMLDRSGQRIVAKIKLKDFKFEMAGLL